jgi:hypothetical protein
VLRQLILSAVLATGTPTPTPPAEMFRFEVLVPHASGWRLHSTYRSHAEADASRIWRKGYCVGVGEK